MERETNLLRIEHQFKFNTIEEAEKEANTIYIYAQRKIIKNNWSCKMLIAIADDYKDCSCKLETVKTGKKGRPIKKVVPVNKKAKKILPHLHILVYANPGETLTKPIVRSINKRHKKNNNCKDVISRRYPIEGERGRYISYTFNQSPKMRYFEHDPQGLLDDFEFWYEYLYFKARHPEFIYFYKKCPYKKL